MRMLCSGDPVSKIRNQADGLIKKDTHTEVKDTLQATFITVLLLHRREKVNLFAVFLYGMSGFSSG